MAFLSIGDALTVTMACAHMKTTLVVKRADVHGVMFITPLTPDSPECLRVFVPSITSTYCTCWSRGLIDLTGPRAELDTLAEWYSGIVVPPPEMVELHADRAAMQQAYDAFVAETRTIRGEVGARKCA